MTEMQTKFLAAFLGPANCNATEAARQAGYSWPGKQGSVVARHPAVRPLIEAEIVRRTPAYTALLARMKAKKRAGRR